MSNRTCSVCGGPEYAKKLCRKHYNNSHYRLSKHLLDVEWKVKAKCHPDQKHYAKGLCRSCYRAKDYATRTKGAVSNPDNAQVAALQKRIAELEARPTDHGAPQETVLTQADLFTMQMSSGNPENMRKAFETFRLSYLLDLRLACNVEKVNMTADEDRAIKQWYKKAYTEKYGDQAWIDEYNEIFKTTKDDALTLAKFFERGCP